MQINLTFTLRTLPHRSATNAALRRPGRRSTPAPRQPEHHQQMQFELIVATAVHVAISSKES